MAIILKNKNEFNKALREDVKLWTRQRQFIIAKTAAVEAKRNVPPTRRHWQTTYSRHYKPKGRLKRGIRSDKRPKMRKGNLMVIAMGVGRKGHLRYSAATHEFGKVITASGIDRGLMKFKVIGKKYPIRTRRVVIRRKEYLRDGIVRSLKRHAHNVNVPRL